MHICKLTQFVLSFDFVGIQILGNLVILEEDIIMISFSNFFIEFILN